MTNKKALILIDLQNDFCPGGALAVPNGHEVIPLANQLQRYFDLVIATQDWHPADHMSFASNHPNYRVGDVIVSNGISQVLWPTHCVQKTYGADFHPDLNLSRVKKIVHKGIYSEIDSYSAFFDNAHLSSTGLSDYLAKEGIDELYLLGLATDYCVKYSALDATQLGFRVHVIQDACRGVELNNGDIAKAIDEMQAAGVTMLSLQDIVTTNQ